ncbi:MAG: methyltransferase [Bdellovibrionota bacterium]
MSSINKYPTFQYSQPSDYHFSHDSVFLAREVFERHSDQLTQPEIKVLDLCAGCGIVGMDLLFHQLKEKSFNGEADFLEVQEIYEPHFNKNKEIMQGYFPNSPLDFNFIHQNYADVSTHKKYDFILSNPPYFLLGQGVKSPSEFKNRCRFFIDSDWQTMLRFMQASLKPEGQAYFLVRDELKDIISQQPASEVTFPFQVRTAWVGHMKKLTSIY